MKLEKLTKRYDDACGTAHALELVGDRWALLIVRELMFGPRRFTDLRGSLPGISANVLTQRLGELERSGVLLRRTLPPPTPVQLYELTSWGYETEEIIKVLGRWAARSPGHDPSLPLSPVSLMLSFRTMFVAERAVGLDLSLGFVLGADQFRAVVADGALQIDRAEAMGQAVISGTAEQIAGVVYGGAPLDSLSVTGDRAAVAQFVRLFSLPPKAG